MHDFHNINLPKKGKKAHGNRKTLGVSTRLLRSLQDTMTMVWKASRSHSSTDALNLSSSTHSCEIDGSIIIILHKQRQMEVVCVHIHHMCHVCASCNRVSHTIPIQRDSSRQTEREREREKGARTPTHIHSLTKADTPTHPPTQTYHYTHSPHSCALCMRVSV